MPEAGLPGVQQRADDAGTGAGGDARRPCHGKQRTWSGCTPATPAFTAPSGSRWTRWTQLGIPYDDDPRRLQLLRRGGRALSAEYTLPGVSQTVIITRMAGRTPVPEREGIAALAAHGATMVVFLSAGMLDGSAGRSAAGRVHARHPGGHWYTRPPGRRKRWSAATVGDAGHRRRARTGSTKTALVLVGDFLGAGLRTQQAVRPLLCDGIPRRRSRDRAAAGVHPKGHGAGRGGWRQELSGDGRALRRRLHAWTPGRPGRLCQRRTRLSMWARRASPCAPSRLMPGIRRRTRPWWRWTSAGRFAVPLLSRAPGRRQPIWPGASALFAARCRRSSPPPRIANGTRSPWTSGPCGRAAVVTGCAAHQTRCRPEYWRAGIGGAAQPMARCGHAPGGRGGGPAGACRF